MNANLSRLIDRLNDSTDIVYSRRLLDCSATYLISEWTTRPTYHLVLKSYNAPVLFITLMADGTPKEVAYSRAWDYSLITQSHIRKFIDYFGLPIPKYAAEIREATNMACLENAKFAPVEGGYRIFNSLVEYRIWAHNSVIECPSEIRRN